MCYLPYEEPIIIDEEGNETIIPGAEFMPSNDISSFRSNENAFVKHCTDRHIPGDFGEEFKKRWLHRTMYSGKERSMAFFEHPQSLQYITMARANLNLIEILDEVELKWMHTFDMIDVSVTTQGQHGNMMKALTIKRQEFADKTDRTQQKGLLAKISNSIKKPEAEPQMIEY